MKKIIIPLVILIFATLLVIRFYPKPEPEDTSHADFALEGITSLLSLSTIEIDILNVEVYETTEDLYYFIEFNSILNDQISYNYVFEGKKWNFRITHGVMDLFPTFTTEFENARVNYIKKTVFTHDQISNMVAIVESND